MYEIRRVHLEDQEVFVKLYLEAYEHLSDYKYTTRREVKNYFRWLFKRDKNGFFAIEKDGKICGFGASDGNWLDKVYGRVLEIHELFVIPSCRGSGMGKRLVEHILSYGKSRGLSIACLWVGEKNFLAINFYKKLKFEVVGKWGKWLRMKRQLTC